MAYCCLREELGLNHRIRRSYYELLRDELDHFMLQYALVDSYNKFSCRKEGYPFVEKRELKPRARIPDVEYECQNTFLVLFVEDSLPRAHKKYVRFFNVNKTTKTNLLRSKTIPLRDHFDRGHKYLDSVHFFNFIEALLPVDYALLVQREPASKTKDRYTLSHFHVRIDWPIAEAAEDMARHLRYISKDLYEKGDKYAELLQRKFFEYYGLPVMAGGRRTAAIVAAQYLRKNNCLSTVYAGSSESRAMIRISEQGVSKYVLMKLSKDEIRQIAADNSMTTNLFNKHYLVAREKRFGLSIFQARYSPTDQALPPADNKLREIKPDLNWVTVSGQYILPKPGSLRFPPIARNMIYS